MNSRKLIFICVEDPHLQYTLATILEREGCQVVSRWENQMADFRLIDEPVDLLILDKSDCWDELWNHELSKIRCRSARQPILILSAHLPDLATFDCEDFGLCRIIQKPSDPAAILENARALLK